MSQEQVRAVLVELDCLLDTRIATIARFDGSIAADIIKDGTYRDRDQDDFEAITDGRVKQADFDEAYKNRDRETLAVSRPTPMMKLLREIAVDQESQKINTPNVDRFKVIVNTYPYELNEKEKRSIEVSVGYYCTIETEIETTSLTYSDITPTEMKFNWDAVILYDFNRWFELHVEEINKVLIPRNLMFAPALYLKQPEDSPEMKELRSAGATPFSLLEDSMIERLDLQLLKASEFSVIK